MHPPSGFTSLVAFLALLTKAAADNSAPFELKSLVLNPPDPTLDGLYLTAFSYHPGGFFFATLAEPSDSNPALVSVLTGTAAQLAAGNGTIEISNVDGTDPVYFQIAPGDATAPSVYDSVQLVPDEATTFGLQFVGDVLNYQDVEGNFYACNENPPTPEGELTPPAGVYRLFYEPADNPTPAGCSTLQLIREPTS